VRAEHVVLAGNVHLGAIVQTIADTLVPVTAFTGVTQPLGNRLPLAMTFGGAVSCSRHASHQYRIVGHDRLLWSGHASGVAGWTRKALERTIRATYPQLGPVQFEQFWPADMGFAVHGMPQIGEVHRGVWLASALGAQGLNTSAMAGSLIARAIVERDDTWRRFLPFELVWAGGRSGRTVARTVAWWWRQSDAIRAFAARRREEFQRKRLEKKSAGSGTAGGEFLGTLEAQVLGARSLASKSLAGISLASRSLANKFTANRIPSGYDPVAAVKRMLKNSFAADDRPIDAPEALPASGPDDGGPDEARRHPGTAAPD
jgi:hypothetical protein